MKKFLAVTIVLVVALTFATVAGAAPATHGNPPPPPPPPEEPVVEQSECPRFTEYTDQGSGWENEPVWVPGHWEVKWIRICIPRIGCFRIPIKNWVPGYWTDWENFQENFTCDALPTSKPAIKAPHVGDAAHPGTLTPVEFNGAGASFYFTFNGLRDENGALIQVPLNVVCTQSEENGNLCVGTYTIPFGLLDGYGQHNAKIHAVGNGEAVTWFTFTLLRPGE